MSEPVQLVALLLVRNEERYLDRVIRNVHDVCDRVIVAENRSTDRTLAVASEWKARSAKVEVHTVDHPRDAHELAMRYAGTRTWILAVDGDEIYDPEGLARFATYLRAGIHDRWWTLFGNVLNCIELDTERGVASGHLAPPCRSMTKLFNFAAIRGWTGVTTERLLGGTIDFKPGWTEDLRLNLHEQVDWDRADFRCLHLCFLPRSAADSVAGGPATGRLNPVELSRKGLRHGWWPKVRLLLGFTPLSDWKRERYMRGDCVTKDVKGFFRP